MTETETMRLPYIDPRDEQIPAEGLDVHFDLQALVLADVSTFDFEQNGLTDELETRVTVERTDFESGKGVELDGEEVIALSIGSGGGSEEESRWDEIGAAAYLNEAQARELRNRLDQLLGNVSEDPSPPSGNMQEQFDEVKEDAEEILDLYQRKNQGTVHPDNTGAQDSLLRGGERVSKGRQRDG